MNHIWCFVIDVLVEMIVKKIWRFLAARARAWMDRVAADMLDMIGLGRAVKWMAGGFVAALGVLAGGIYLWARRSQAKAA